MHHPKEPMMHMLGENADVHPGKLKTHLSHHVLDPSPTGNVPAKDFGALQIRDP